MILRYAFPITVLILVLLMLSFDYSQKAFNSYFKKNALIKQHIYKTRKTYIYLMIGMFLVTIILIPFTPFLMIYDLVVKIRRKKTNGTI